MQKKNKIKIIGISSNLKSNLIKLSNVKILIPKVIEAGNKHLNMIPTSSSINLLSFGDCIAIALATKNKFDKKKFSRLHPSGSIGKKLADISQVMIAKKKNSVCLQRIYFAGNSHENFIGKTWLCYSYE